MIDSKKHHVELTIDDRIYTLAFDSYEHANEVYMVIEKLIASRTRNLTLELRGPEE